MRLTTLCLFAGLTILPSAATIRAAGPEELPADGMPADGLPGEGLPGSAVPDGAASVPPEVPELVEQLGDVDPAVREAATARLRELGKAALPALEAEKDSDDPELRARVRGLIRKALRRLPPAAPPRDGRFNRRSVRVSIVNGQKTVDVDDNGYRIRIRQGAGGIEMDVTGIEDGREATETYKAKDADELKREVPEAFALYEKYVDGQMGGGGIGIGMGPARPGVAGRVIRDEDLAVQLPPHVHERIARAQGEAMARHRELVRRMEEENIARAREQAERLRQMHRDVQEDLTRDIQIRREELLERLREPMREEPAEQERK